MATTGVRVSQDSLRLFARLADKETKTVYENIGYGILPFAFGYVCTNDELRCAYRHFSTTNFWILLYYE
jgi:hypothetical protein